MRKRRALGLAQRAEPHDQRSHHHLGGAPAAVVAFHRDADTDIRQRAAVDALGADLDEDARAEPLHHFGAEAPGAGDVPGMRRTGGTQPRRRLGAFGREAMPGAEGARRRAPDA